MTGSSSGFYQPSVWREVHTKELTDWIRQTQKESPHPIYSLAEPSVVQSLVKEFAPPDISEWLRVRSDSGCVEVDFRGRLQARQQQTVSRDILGIALNLAERIDPRKFLQRRTPETPARRPDAVGVTESISREYRSEVDGLEVMGPGGRIVFFDGGVRGVDLVVRRRERKLGSTWRQPQRVARRTLDELADAPKELRLQAAFGYYEASKYEHQTVLRPAFAFLLGLAAGEATPAWRTILVEPATSTPDISAWAGLESWAEVEEEE
jgi:hypothetical protein